MTAIIITFAAVVLGLGAYTLAALSRDGWRRAAGPALLALASITVLAGGAAALGRPKPAWLELPSGEDVQVLHVEMEEGRAIWLLLAVPGRSEPTLYALPWSERQAAGLYHAEQEAKQKGGAVMMGNPFGVLNNGTEQPYPKPVQPLPPKGGANG